MGMATTTKYNAFNPSPKQDLLLLLERCMLWCELGPLIHIFLVVKLIDQNDDRKR